MNQLNQMEIFRVIDNYVGDLIDNPNDKYGDFVDNLCNYTVENCFGEKINDLTIADLTPVSNIKKTLNSVFNSHSRLSFNERWKLLTNLSKNKFFQQFGSGILTRLAMFASQKSRQEFHNLFYVEIETNSREFSQPRKAHFGGYKDRNSFSEMLNLRNRVLNRNYNVEYFD
jgi:hypothetical protein